MTKASLVWQLMEGVARRGKSSCAQQQYRHNNAGAAAAGGLG